LTLFRPKGGVPTEQLQSDIIVKKNGHFTVNTGSVTIKQHLDFVKAEGLHEPIFFDCDNLFLPSSDEE